MFSQDLRAVIRNTSTFVKFVCLSCTCGYLLSFMEDSVTVMSVTPGYLSPPNFWIWTLFTFWTLEVHFLSFVADILTVLFCGKLIEPLWKSLEMWKFFAIVNTFVAIISSGYSLFYSMITQNSEHLYDTHIYGLAGYIAAVAVAVRQILPDHLIAKTPIGRFTNRSVPLAALILIILLWSVGLMNGQTPVMFASGIFVSWIYLRFYQKHSRGGSRGDGAENFTFASFFPTIMQPGINVIATPIYNLCLRLSIIQKFAPPSETASLDSVNITYPHDIERRRQIALKALNERLSKSSPDASRLPKSFPHTSKLQQHQFQQMHQTLMQNQFFPPAIALPPPSTSNSEPVAGTSASPSSSHQDRNVMSGSSISHSSSMNTSLLNDAEIINIDEASTIK